MRLELKNIGLIKDSSIDLNGLTIITGKNNSGKTTVGKALYSIIDASAYIPEKAEFEKLAYSRTILYKLSNTLYPFGIICNRAEESDPSKMFIPSCDRISEVLRFEIPYFENVDELKKYIQSINAEFSVFYELYQKEKSFRASIQKHVFKDDGISIVTVINKSKDMLGKLLEDIDSDPTLVNYRRTSYEETLKQEFAQQIQPVFQNIDKSEINLFDDAVIVRLEIENNTVKPLSDISFTQPRYTRALFIDDPLILERSMREERSPRRYSENAFLNVSGVVQPHHKRLLSALNKKPTDNAFEQFVNSKELEHIKRTIDDLIPGSYEFGKTDTYYIENGKKLKFENLATGSKVISMVKILLEKGLLNDSTVLILDEPESHLHPEWQDVFAEIIVALVKYANINVLLTTHSPSFVLSLDAYMRKYGIEEKTSIYQTSTNIDGTVGHVCMNDNLSLVYSDFSEPFVSAKVLRDMYLNR